MSEKILLRRFFVHFGPQCENCPVNSLGQIAYYFCICVALSTFSSCLLAVTSDLEALMSAFLTVELALLPFETVLSSEARNESETHT